METGNWVVETDLPMSQTSNLAGSIKKERREIFILNHFYKQCQNPIVKKLMPFTHSGALSENRIIATFSMPFLAVSVNQKSVWKENAVSLIEE